MDLREYRSADLNIAQDQVVGTPYTQRESRLVLAWLHETARHLAHVITRARELTAQEIGLDTHRFLQIGGMYKLARMLKGRLHVLLGKSERLLRYLRPRARNG